MQDSSRDHWPMEWLVSSGPLVSSSDRSVHQQERGKEHNDKPHPKPVPICSAYQARPKFSGDTLEERLRKLKQEQENSHSPLALHALHEANQMMLSSSSAAAQQPMALESSAGNQQDQCELREITHMEQDAFHDGFSDEFDSDDEHPGDEAADLGSGREAYGREGAYDLEGQMRENTKEPGGLARLEQAARLRRPISFSQHQPALTLSEQQQLLQFQQQLHQHQYSAKVSAFTYELSY